MVKVKLMEEFDPKVVLMGFRGIGQVGYLSINYLIEKLKMKRMGVIETLYIPPVVTVGDNGLLYPIEIYGYKDLGIVRIEEVPLNKSGAYIIREIVKWLSLKRIEGLILIGGLVSNLREDEKDISRIVHNSYWTQKIDMKYTQKDVRVLGPLAYALFFSEIYKVPTIAILSYANSEQLIDPRGTYYALESLKKIISLDVDTEELLIKADEIEEKLSQFIREINEPRYKGMYT